MKIRGNSIIKSKDEITTLFFTHNDCGAEMKISCRKSLLIKNITKEDAVILRDDLNNFIGLG